MLINWQELENIQKILASRLKKLRAMKSWKQIDLAEESGKSLSAIAQIETGKIWPTPETIKALAEALGVDQEQLFIDTSKKKRVPSEQVREAVQDVFQLIGEFPVDVLQSLAHADRAQLDSIRSVLSLESETAQDLQSLRERLDHLEKNAPTDKPKVSRLKKS